MMTTPGASGESQCNVDDIVRDGVAYVGQSAHDDPQSCVVMVTDRVTQSYITTAALRLSGCHPDTDKLAEPPSSLEANAEESAEWDVTSSIDSGMNQRRPKQLSVSEMPASGKVMLDMASTQRHSSSRSTPAAHEEKTNKGHVARHAAHRQRGDMANSGHAAKPAMSVLNTTAAREDGQKRVRSDDHPGLINAACSPSYRSDGSIPPLVDVSSSYSSSDSRTDSVEVDHQWEAAKHRRAATKTYKLDSDEGEASGKPVGMMMHGGVRKYSPTKATLWDLRNMPFPRVRPGRLQVGLRRYLREWQRIERGHTGCQPCRGERAIAILLKALPTPVCRRIEQDLDTLSVKHGAKDETRNAHWPGVPGKCTWRQVCFLARRACGQQDTETRAAAAEARKTSPHAEAGASHQLLQHREVGNQRAEAETAGNPTGETGSPRCGDGDDSDDSLPPLFTVSGTDSSSDSGSSSDSDSSSEPAERTSRGWPRPRGRYIGIDTLEPAPWQTRTTAHNNTPAVERAPTNAPAPSHGGVNADAPGVAQHQTEPGSDGSFPALVAISGYNTSSEQSSSEDGHQSAGSCPALVHTSDSTSASGSSSDSSSGSETESEPAGSGEASGSDSDSDAGGGARASSAPTRSAIQRRRGHASRGGSEAPRSRTPDETQSGATDQKGARESSPKVEDKGGEDVAKHDIGYNSDSSLPQLGAGSSSSEESYSDWVSGSDENEQPEGERVTVAEVMRSREDERQSEGSLPPLVDVSSSSSDSESDSESDTDSDLRWASNRSVAGKSAEESAREKDGHHSEGSLPLLVDVSSSS